MDNPDQELSSALRTRSSATAEQALRRRPRPLGGRRPQVRPGGPTAAHLAGPRRRLHSGLIRALVPSAKPDHTFGRRV